MSRTTIYVEESLRERFRRINAAETNSGQWKQKCWRRRRKREEGDDRRIDGGARSCAGRWGRWICAGASLYTRGVGQARRRLPACPVEPARRRMATGPQQTGPSAPRRPTGTAAGTTLRGKNGSASSLDPVVTEVGSLPASQRHPRRTTCRTDGRTDNRSRSNGPARFSAVKCIFTPAAVLARQVRSTCGAPPSGRHESYACLGVHTVPLLKAYRSFWNTCSLVLDSKCTPTRSVVVFKIGKEQYNGTRRHLPKNKWQVGLNRSYHSKTSCLFIYLSNMNIQSCVRWAKLHKQRLVQKY